MAEAMSAPYAFSPAVSDADLQAILAIQGDNAPQVLSDAEQREQGFVTVRHDLALLRAMNEAFPHAVARHGEAVVGYALCMLPDFVVDLPILRPLHELIGQLRWEESRLAERPFVIMGQVAVAKLHRGRRLVDGMYDDLCDRLYPRYEYLLTSIALRNTRSRRVHERAGFTELAGFWQHGERWLVVGRKTGSRLD